MMKKYILILIILASALTSPGQGPTLAIRNFLLGTYTGTYWDFNQTQFPVTAGVNITALPNDSTGIISHDTINNTIDTLFIGFYYDINHQFVVDTFLHFLNLNECGDIYPANDSIFYAVCKASSQGEPTAYFSLICTHHSIPTNIKNNTLNNFIVYPVPANTNIYIEFIDEKDKNRHYELFDNTGRIVTYGVISKQKNEIEISSMPSGIYFLKINSDEKIVVKKIIKTN